MKTRLAAELGPGRALELYRAMLADVLEGIGPPDETIDIDIAWTAGGEVRGEELRESFGSHHLTMQTGKDLGERLVVAFSERIVLQGAGKIVAIGVDDPGLDRECVDRAFRLLDGCEWVVGPALDGGYYLIGCRAASFHPSVFERIEWGTRKVFGETEESIRGLGATLAVLPARSDIDVPADLERWAGDPGPGAVRVRDLIRQWGIAR